MLHGSSAISELLRLNKNDCLSFDPFGRVECGDGIVESSHLSDVCPQPTIPNPLDEFTQLGAIRYNNEVDSGAVSGPCLSRTGDGNQRSSGANHASRTLRDVAAEDIENQIYLSNIFYGVVIEVDELLRTEIESRLTTASAPCTNYVSSGITCELGRHRTNYTGCTVHEDALSRTKAPVFEQALPRGQT
jgi:hypothetical protein